ncbi:SPOR domain-containing protein [Microvirga sp. BT350]|uniref:SPOR domain-containing protein n=1 Tax=Microvirga alba TaxID=2791025 RepID=A0A931BRE8_9HYPH|nr:SPOR domain-containing protein [Microvirga alba]
MKPRFAVDLTEIERQLAQAQGAPSQSASAGRSDPLAELARIVGQDDPFQSLLATDAAGRPRSQAGSGLDDLFATREEVRSAPRSAQPQARQAGHGASAFDLDQYQQVESRASEPAYAYQAAAPSQGHEAYADPAYDQGYYDDNAQHHPAAAGYEQAESMDYEPVEKRRSRKGFIAIGAVIGAAVIGIGGAYVLNGKSGAVTGGQPPLIKATNEPIKVQPQNPGGVEIPNQNKQIYERANPNAETKVVSRDEQPVDVKQVARMNGASAEATGATAPAANSLNLGEPRKVRTVSIRPDGSTVRPDGSTVRPDAAATRPASAPVAPPAMALPAAAQAAPAMPMVPVATPAAQPKPAAGTPVAAPATPAQKPAAAAATPATAQALQKVASAQPMVPAPSAASEVTGTGGYSVQLAVRGSEGEAQTAFQQLQKKFDDLDGAPPMIRKAEVNGNTVYRVRVGPMSRDEASSLCTKLQGQGGQCFVAKN